MLLIIVCVEKPRCSVWNRNYIHTYTVFFILVTRLTLWLFHQLPISGKLYIHSLDWVGITWIDPWSIQMETTNGWIDRITIQNLAAHLQIQHYKLELQFSYAMNFWVRQMWMSELFKLLKMLRYCEEGKPSGSLGFGKKGDIFRWNILGFLQYKFISGGEGVFFLSLSLSSFR